jgi:hypothetical protein
MQYQFIYWFRKSVNRAFFKKEADAAHFLHITLPATAIGGFTVAYFYLTNERATYEDTTYYWEIFQLPGF